jgi:hypothetical protein
MASTTAVAHFGFMQVLVLCGGTAIEDGGETFRPGWGYTQATDSRGTATPFKKGREGQQKEIVASVSQKNPRLKVKVGGQIPHHWLLSILSDVKGSWPMQICSTSHLCQILSSDGVL